MVSSSIQLVYRPVTTGDILLTTMAGLRIALIGPPNTIRDPEPHALVLGPSSSDAGSALHDFIRQFSFANRVTDESFQLIDGALRLSEST